MIDWTRIAQLQQEVGADDFAEVVELFLGEAEEVSQRLAETAEPARLAADLHFLKGSALTLGFTALAELCRDAEEQVAQNRQGKVLTAIRSCHSASRQAFLAGYRTGSRGRRSVLPKGRTEPRSHHW
ncbi:Hpt domain-containing protein [Sulfitobacter aestuarii]|uniref:Hpt domain-containing protein n=1 Tax=Sulfitobacter aestuarii TaxID=2161676 RepID=A0ABW5TZH4_9RHOB